MSNVIAKNNLAKIAISKNLIKEYKTSESERTVYLNDGTEFQIYLKNPYQFHVGVKIYVNDKSIGNTLVLRPGQSCWLDRFLDNENKFLFSTYAVEDTAEMRYATAKNGNIRVEFYREKEVQELVVSTITSYLDYNTSKSAETLKNTTSDWINDNCNISTSSAKYYYNSNCACDSILGCNSVLNSAVDCLCSQNIDLEIDTAATKAASSKTMETGRIEQGSHSDQKFESCDIKFNYWSFDKEYIQILPNSRKQVRAEETRRKYCSQCGKKVGPKDKFCSNCGAKLN